MVILYFTLWIILNGRVTAEIIIFGLIFSAAIAVFGYKMFDYGPRNELRLLRNIPLFIVYILNLILEIIKSTGAVMSVALSRSKKPEPEIIEFHSGLESKLQNVLLANSITLTPGTFTLFQEGDYFMVHCLRKEYAEGMEDSSFVRLLRKFH